MTYLEEITPVSCLYLLHYTSKYVGSPPTRLNKNFILSQENDSE